MGKAPIRLIINRFRPLMVQSNDMLSQGDILDILSVNLIGVVPEDDSVIKASNSGEPLSFDQRTPAGEAYSNIAARILGEEVPLLPLDSMPDSILSSLKKMFGF
jgi:septum site-determining protein MinD